MAFTPNAASQQENKAQVIYGSYQETDECFVGMTIRQVRHARARQWNIPTNTVALRGRDQVNEDYVVKRGDVIEFSRRQGDKG